MDIPKEYPNSWKIGDPKLTKNEANFSFSQNMWPIVEQIKLND